MNACALRKKAPEKLQEQLLETTSIIVAKNRCAALTLNAVVSQASVSKRESPHNYPGRQELIRGLLTRGGDNEI